METTITAIFNISKAFTAVKFDIQRKDKYATEMCQMNVLNIFQIVLICTAYSSTNFALNDE